MTDKPKRIQRSRANGWRMPDGAIYVGRPTIWGNPFIVGKKYGWGIPGESEIEGPFTPIKDRREAVAVYRSWLEDQHDILCRIIELRGKDLACWCPLTDACHADVLLELANSPEST